MVAAEPAKAEKNIARYTADWKEKERSLLSGANPKNGTTYIKQDAGKGQQKSF